MTASVHERGCTYGEREERERDRQTDRQTERESERERQRETERETERDRERDRERDKDRERKRESERETDRETERMRERNGCDEALFNQIVVLFKIISCRAKKKLQVEEEQYVYLRKESNDSELIV